MKSEYGINEEVPASVSSSQFSAVTNPKMQRATFQNLITTPIGDFWKKFRMEVMLVLSFKRTSILPIKTELTLHQFGCQTENMK